MAYNSIWALQTETCQEALDSLCQELTAHFSETRALMDAPPATPAPSYENREGIAVISVSGVIDRTARISFFTGQPYTAGQNRIRAALDAAMADASVQGILFSFNSPGGVVAGTKELADYIAQCGKKKPMAAYADGLCASAAYWLAAATGRIFAPVTAQVGSIGVIAVLTDWTKAAEKAGLMRTVLSSGQWKAAGSRDKALTEDERALFQSQLEALHEIFKGDIGRFMRPKGEDWAEGQTFLGQDAKGRGLVTAIVADQAAALEKLAAISAKGVKSMDLTQLKAEHPDLLAQYKAELEKANGPEDGELAEAARKARADTLALVAAVAGEEAAAKIDAVMAAGITAEQFKALSGMFPKAEAAPPAPSGEQKARAEILAGIQQAHGDALNAAPSRPAASSLVLEVERIAQEAK